MKENTKEKDDLYICPKCGGELVYSNDQREVACKTESCSFGKERFVIKFK